MFIEQPDETRRDGQTPAIGFGSYNVCSVPLSDSDSESNDDSDQRRVIARTDPAYRALRALTLRKYGLTPDTYEAIHDAQGGVCAICLQPETQKREGTAKRLAVDHRRETGRVRQLLCCRCNQAIGLLRENPTVIRHAAAYIERHQAQERLTP